MLLNSLKNKVTVYGKGLEGAAAADFLTRLGCNVEIVCDPLDKALDGVVVKSPGISLYRDDVKKAAQNGVVFTSGTNLFMEYCAGLEKRPVLIGVTATKGKSTTSTLIAHLLNALGHKTALGGNIGKPVVSYAFEAQNYDFVVDEVSSYQAADLKHGFDVCAVLNLYPEHIDWHLTHENYYHDKLNILRVRKDGQKAVLNAQNDRLRAMTQNEKDVVFYNDGAGVHLQDGMFYDVETPLFETSVLHLRGEHNLENACAALTVLKILGFDLKQTRAGLESFRALPHRLQPLGEKKGALFVNDSISTTPETAIAAMEAFAGKKIALIAGGYDRKQEYADLAAYIAKRGDVTVVTVPSTGHRLAQAVRDAGAKAYEASDLPSAVDVAVCLNADVILLSPAAPSYDFYKNFEERGTLFKACFDRI